MRCPTLCDDDCEANCHEGHNPRHKQAHDPIQCGARQLLEARAREVGLSEKDIAWARNRAREFPGWAGLFGIDPDFTDGKDISEWLDEQRGEA